MSKRDRALIALRLYICTFARVLAATSMNVEEYYPQRRRIWMRFHEPCGRQHDVRARYVLGQYLDEYITAAGIGVQKRCPLFRAAAGTTGRLTERRTTSILRHPLEAKRAAQQSRTQGGNFGRRNTGCTSPVDTRPRYDTTCAGGQAPAYHRLLRPIQSLKGVRKWPLCRLATGRF